MRTYPPFVPPTSPAGVAAAKLAETLDRLAGAGEDRLDRPAGVASNSLAESDALAHKLRLVHRKIGDVSWALDEGLSAVRKAAAGYRAPDAESGREQEHFGIDPADLAKRIFAAARLLRALETLDI